MLSDPISGKETAQVLAEHYQNTYELTHELWKERNNLFLILVAFLAGATLLFSLPGGDSNKLIVTWLANLSGLKDNEKNILLSGVNVSLLQILVLAVIFYLIISLYRHTQDVLRLYAYLDHLEHEIRYELKLTGDAFTRESGFYWTHRSWLLGLVGTVYTMVLLLLLTTFLGPRLAIDWAGGFAVYHPPWAAVADTILSFVIGVYFIGYAVSSMPWLSKLWRSIDAKLSTPKKKAIPQTQ